MRAEFITPDSPVWHEALASIPHDFYHLPNYVDLAARLEARLEGGEPMAYVAERDGHWLLVPLLVRAIPDDLYNHQGIRMLKDASSPRVYSGPVVGCDGGTPKVEIINIIISKFINDLRDFGIIAFFSRMHPVLSLPIDPLIKAGCIVQFGETVSIDLTLSREELWKQTRHNHRRAINKAAGRGYVARIDSTWEALEEFIDIYHETMRRVDANSYCYLSRDYLREIKQILEGQINLCIVEIEGRVASAGLFTEVCGNVEYYLGGTRDEYVADSPSKTMYHFVRGWAKDRGNRVFHLGGSPKPWDSVFDLKAGFSPIRHPVFTWRVVTDGIAYRKLVHLWESCHSAKADSTEGFFPAYRKLL